MNDMPIWKCQSFVEKSASFGSEQDAELQCELAMAELERETEEIGCSNAEMVNLTAGCLKVLYNFFFFFK